MGKRVRLNFKEELPEEPKRSKRVRLQQPDDEGGSPTAVYSDMVRGGRDIPLPLKPVLENPGGEPKWYEKPRAGYTPVKQSRPKDPLIPAWPDYDYGKPNPLTGEEWEIDPMTGRYFHDPLSHGPRPNGLLKKDITAFTNKMGREEAQKWIDDMVYLNPHFQSRHTDKFLADYEVPDRTERMIYGRQPNGSFIPEPPTRPKLGRRR